MAPAKQTESAKQIEAGIIARAQQGDGEAFQMLYEAHKRRVYSICLRMVNNQSEAEDLTQEAFLQLFRKIATFREKRGAFFCCRQ